tara:strand:+ start:10403 stop:11593 length:1191 start_codon:yes stop_codon:yes gene_type:complete
VKRNYPYLKKIKIAICAGEISGDNLGSELIKELKLLFPQAEFFGVAGPKMISQGCKPFYKVDQLSVMGLLEVLRHLPRILWLRFNLINKIKKIKPNLFIGIDAPDFNLPIGYSLKKLDIPVVQYVSPQVWAWRQSRVRKIKNSVDLMLCILPFEKNFYKSNKVESLFVGHPIADQIPYEVDYNFDRKEFSIQDNQKVLAILPGSRSSEIKYLAEPFIKTAQWLLKRFSNLLVLIALSDEDSLKIFLKNNKDLMSQINEDDRFKIIIGKARSVISASNVVLTASGTASLEVALIKKPMVVAYIVSDISYWIFNKLGLDKLASFSLPNLLSNSKHVPEYSQEEVRPDKIGQTLESMLKHPKNFEKQKKIFNEIHIKLRINASKNSAKAIYNLINKSNH